MSEYSRSFYLVWNPHRGVPKTKHDDFQSARAEAERLSRQQPGEKFHVLRSVGTAQAVNVEFERHMPRNAYEEFAEPF